MKVSAEKRERLRRDLPSIRIMAGWSAERLADILDVTRATVVNIENNEGRLSTVQYYAIRYILDEEIRATGNEVLAQVITDLVDSEDTPESRRSEIRLKISLAAKKVGRKSGATAISREAMTTVSEFLNSKVSEIQPDAIERGNAYIQKHLTDQLTDANNG